MRRVLAGWTGAAFVVLGGPVFAEVQTIKGQLVDRNCYIQARSSVLNEAQKNNNTGNDHIVEGLRVGCAQQCVRLGAPVALVTAKGSIYTITGALAANDGANLVAHLSHTVEVTGDVMEGEKGLEIAGGVLKMISK